MKRTIFTFITAACLALTAVAQNNPVATISGNLDVTSLGAATYHIPITVPKGVNGLQPNISLDYNSNGGNGIAGWGFSLNAYSMISRTGRDIVHDGISKPITWDENDNFLLDGQRLIMVKQAGTYLTPGNEYRTEIESYRKISIIAANTSTGFQVQAKDGTIYEYGTSEDSQFYLEDHSTSITKGILHWLLHKVTDPNGNYITYYYGKDKANNEFCIARIEYGGNVNAGTKARETIMFGYEYVRPDCTGREIGGCMAKQTKLLTSIQSSHLDYFLDYGTFDGNVSKLKSIEVQNAQGESLNKTNINWNDPDQSTSVQDLKINYSYNKNNYTAYQSTFVDLDLDGVPEIVGDYGDKWVVCKSSDGINYTDKSPANNGFANPYDPYYPRQWLAEDINHDGYVDMLIIEREYHYPYFRVYDYTFQVLLNDHGTLINQNANWTLTFSSSFKDDVTPVKGEFDSYGYINGKPMANFTVDKSFKSTFSLVDLGSGNLSLKEERAKMHTEHYSNKGNYGWTKDLKLLLRDFWDQYAIRTLDVSTNIYTLDLSKKNIELTPSSTQVIINHSQEQTNTTRFNDGDRVPNNAYNYYGLNDNLICVELYPIHTFISTSGDFMGLGHPQTLSICGSSAYISDYKSGASTQLDISKIDPVLNTTDKLSVSTVCDLNNDGKEELIVYNSTTRQYYVIQQINGTFKKVIAFKTSEMVNFKVLWDDTSLTYSFYPIDHNGTGNNELLICETGRRLGIIKFTSSADGTIDGYTEVMSIPVPNLRYNLVTEYQIGSAINGNAADVIRLIRNNIPNDQRLSYVKFNSADQYKIKSIQDGLGNTQSINYNTLSESSVYSTGASLTANSSNVAKVLFPDFKVVASTSLTNGSNQLSTNYYKYEGMNVNTTGYGMIGFDNTSISSISGELPTSEEDIQSAIDTAFKTNTTYGYDPTYYIPYMTGQTVSKNGTLISSLAITNQVRTSNVGGFTLNANKILQPYVSVQTATDHFSGNTSTTEYLSFDTENNPSKIKTTKGGVVKIDDMTYISKGSWCKNKLADVTSTLTYGTNAPYIRTSSYTYDATNGNLLTTVSDPSDDDMKVTNTFTYDKFGNQLTVYTTTNGASRSSSYTYYPSGRFIQTKKDIVGNTTTYVWDETKGTLTSETDRRGTTTYAYNNWKTVISKTLPTGITQYALTSWANDVAGAVYKTESSVSKGAPPVTQWYDVRGNVIQTKTYYLKSGSPVYQFTEYNKNGSIQRTSSPTYTPTTKTWDRTYGYDSFGRVVEVKTSDGINSIAYGANTTTYTKSSGQSKTVNTNSEGWTSSVVDNGKTITYDYYPSGLVKTIHTDATTHYDMEYNLHGNRTKMTDPDAGIITSQYNGFGDINQEINNKSVITKYFYGGPGGALSLRDRNGEQTKYRYDNLGRLIEKVVCAYDRKTYTYDTFDRVTKLVEVIGVKPYTTEYKYDATGHETTHTYHSGYKTTNTYDDYGQLTDITDSYQKSIWTSPIYDAKGKLTSVVRGGVTCTSTFDDLGRLQTNIAAKGTNAPIINMGYTYSNGNLSSRTDLVNKLSESFHYDELDRLKSWSIYNYIPLVSNGPQVPSKGVNITYDDEASSPKGNIIQKSDIGNYQMKYNARRIHALDSIIGKPDSITSSNWDVKYNTFNKPTKITQAEIRDAQLKVLSPTKTYNITYGADDQRIQTQSCITYAPQQTTTYTDDYEEVFNNITGGYQLIHYLRGAIFTQRYDKTGTKVGPDSLMFTYHDQQGSLIALADESGNVIERYAYDPWGKRRNPAEWTEYDKRTKWITHRGYTCHEHIDFMSGLINMNGRVYDPVTAQFLSPDPVLQAPYSWVNYNRYAYCMNNPLKYTDPSGYAYYGNAYDQFIMRDEDFTKQYESPADFFSNPLNQIVSVRNISSLPTGSYRFSASGIGDYGTIKQTASSWSVINTANQVYNSYQNHVEPNPDYKGFDFNKENPLAWQLVSVGYTQAQISQKLNNSLNNGQGSGAGSDDRIFNFNGIVNTVNTGVGLLQHELKTQAKAGGNLAEIAQASKQLSKITAPFKILGSALGAYSAYGHWNKFSEAYNTGDTNAAIINGGKLLLDGVFLISKSTNPLFLGASVAYGVTDYLTSDY
jgi:RHS repeat-associated protein